MEWLNYHHLYYFWVVAKEGSISAACRRLHLAQPTISAQLHALEQALGVQLFSRSGRNLVLTDAGRLAYRRAEEIFGIGRDMLSELRGVPSGTSTVRVQVGLTDTLPKLLAHRLLSPLYEQERVSSLQCLTGKHADLVLKLSMFELDMVLTDEPLSGQFKVKAYNHLLGESDLTVFCASKQAEKYRGAFPECLVGAPFLLPSSGSMLRRVLEAWLDEHEIAPNVRGEVEDPTMLKIFGQDGLGLFVMPTVEADEMQRQYRVRAIGRMQDARLRYYAISTERRVRHPAVLAITEAAHDALFEAH